MQNNQKPDSSTQNSTRSSIPLGHHHHQTSAGTTIATKQKTFFSGQDFTHSTYSECLNSYPELSEYWSCCFARHPYKRYLSHLTWRAKKIKNIKSWSTADWKSYAKRGINNFCKRNLLHYAYNKKKSHLRYRDPRLRDPQRVDESYLRENFIETGQPLGCNAQSQKPLFEGHLQHQPE